MRRISLCVCVCAWIGDIVQAFGEDLKGLFHEIMATWLSLAGPCTMASRSMHLSMSVRLFVSFILACVFKLVDDFPLWHPTQQ